MFFVFFRLTRRRLRHQKLWPQLRQHRPLKRFVLPELQGFMFYILPPLFTMFLKTEWMQQSFVKRGISSREDTRYVVGTAGRPWPYYLLRMHRASVYTPSSMGTRVRHRLFVKQTVASSLIKLLILLSAYFLYSYAHGKFIMYVLLFHEVAYKCTKANRSLCPYFFSATIIYIQGNKNTGSVLSSFDYFST
jgi:hypothetical protein